MISGLIEAPVGIFSLETPNSFLLQMRGMSELICICFPKAPHLQYDLGETRPYFQQRSFPPRGTSTTEDKPKEELSGKTIKKGLLVLFVQGPCLDNTGEGAIDSTKQSKEERQTAFKERIHYERMIGRLDK